MGVGPSGGKGGAVPTGFQKGRIPTARHSAINRKINEWNMNNRCIRGSFDENGIVFFTLQTSPGQTEQTTPVAATFFSEADLWNSFLYRRRFLRRPVARISKTTVRRPRTVSFLENCPTYCSVIRDSLYTSEEDGPHFEGVMSVESASTVDVATHRGPSGARSCLRGMRPYARVGSNYSTNEV